MLLGRQVAGRFTIKRFLGEGGMATVYVAEQSGELREVALKIMNEDLNADRTFVKRFQREAKAAARVQHPNSVRIIDYGVADNRSYIAMELLQGDDLYSLLEREGAISQGRAVRILIEVCDALMVAHELGIVHRDLKPENIMVIADPADPRQERVKVLDFGIAKLLAPDALAGDGRIEQASAVTRAGTFIGTPAYMSPEQCSLLPVDTRADIYTCGVLLFQLVTGRLPFEGQTPLHTATLHIHEPAPRPSLFAPALDPRLEAIIMKALAKKVIDRHQTARHLASTLRKILPDLPDMTVAQVTKPAQSVHALVTRQVSAEEQAELTAPERSNDAVLDDVMDSARTVVAHGMVGPPPSVVLHAEDMSSSLGKAAASPAPFRSPPSPRSAAFADTAPIDSEDFARTLVRRPSEEALPPRFGPKRTEVIAPAEATSSGGGVGASSVPRSAAAPGTFEQGGAIPVKPDKSEGAFASTERPPPNPLMADAMAFPEMSRPMALNAAGRTAPTIATSLAPRPTPSLTAIPSKFPLPPASFPMTPPAAPAPQGSGSRGMLIGFLLGALIMALGSVAYLVLHR